MSSVVPPVPLSPRQRLESSGADSQVQDFYATIFITTLEAVLTAVATTQLEKNTSKNRHPQPVNQEVSFNAIKNYVIALFYLENNSEESLKQLSQLFID